jgi:hypothetical protein
VGVAGALGALGWVADGLVVTGIDGLGLGSGYRLRRPDQSGACAPSENCGIFCF